MTPRFSVRHPVTVLMVMLGIAILGVISLNRLGTDLLPSLYNPRIVVDLRSGERSPQEMEERFARQLEGELRSVSRAVDVRTVCALGRVQLTTTFTWGADMDFALLDVQKKIARYESRPDVDQVTIARVDPQAEPIMIYALSGTGDQDLDELRRVAENVVKLSLERLDGVAQASIYGGLTREVRVELDEYLLAAYSLKPADVGNAIRQSNANASGGVLEHENTAYNIKGIGRFTGLEDIAGVIVGYRSSGGDSLSAGGQEQGRMFGADRAPVYLKDVARVFYMPEERSSLVRINGRECVGLYIYREAQDNTVVVSGQVREALGRTQADNPGLVFDLVYDQGAFISGAVGEVKVTAVFGVALAVLVLFAFLRNMGATVIVSLAIPLSILATFTLMYFQEMTLNIMTLGGLALGAGMLVDNAIVVIENIFRRRQLGESAEQAAVQGTAEVGVAIVASTLTTIVVFLPIVYVQGVAAELFREQAWVVAYALLSSLLVAFMFIPAAAARLFGSEAVTIGSQGLRFVWYERLLSGALDRRWLVVALALGLLAAAALILPRIGSEFIPRSAENQLQVELELTPGTPLKNTGGTLDGVESRIVQILGDGVRQRFSTVNVTSTQALIQEIKKGGEHQAIITLTLENEGERRLTPEQAMSRLRPHLEDIPGATASFRIRETSLQQTIGATEAPVEVEIRGPDMETLRTLGERARETLEGIAVLHSVETGVGATRPEIDLRVDRVMAASFGVDIQQITQRVRERLEGETLTDFFSEGEDRNIRMVFPEIHLDDLGDMPVQTENGAMLRLRDIAQMTRRESPGVIQRHNQSRVVTVTAHLTEGVSLDQATDRIMAGLNAMSLPPGYQFRLGSAEASRRESFDQLRFALILSIILVYMVMASLFESLRHPFTILLTLPLAGIGVVFTFLLAGEPFSVMALIGVVMLGGIAVNNAIILVDYIGRLRSVGMDRRRAVLQAARDRLRPILMTSLTTILALLPLTLGIGEGAQLRAPMALAIIGGLVSSTLLTLVVIPVVYELLDGREETGDSA